MEKIPLSKPFITGKEEEYLRAVVSSGQLASDGPFTHRCSRLLEERFGIHRVLMTPSCTSSLEMAIMLCDLEPGDEVIMPSFTFVSSANAVVRAGGRPVFVDIRSDTLNLDETLVSRAVTSKTKAIMPVHYAGVGCEMDSIMSIAEDRRLIVIEDAAQGVNAFYRGRVLGSIGHIGGYSFHDTKNYTCGEGGAICINSPELVERAEIIREKGTNRSKFFRGEVDKYSWVDVGSSFIPSEISCAFLCAQLEAMEAITERRRQIFDRYLEAFSRLEEAGIVQMPSIPEGCQSNYHIFYLLVRDRQTRDELMAALKRWGIQAVFHYVPLHTSQMGQKLGYEAGDLPLTENLSERLLRLPLFNDISESEQARVIDGVTRVLTGEL
ncbi:MAG TPA: dTDP-4-amino-4,6-dideoxygalactose transaminase [Blastocatellia bacterium]|nr:dTDP-4-amino-4,6-dideoxygalactose transaminase [Blastocatellia bacterium]